MLFNWKNENHEVPRLNILKLRAPLQTRFFFYRPEFGEWTQSAWNIAGMLQQCSEPCTTFRTLLQHSCNIPVATLQCESCRNVAGTLQREHYNVNVTGTLQRQHCGLWPFPN
ncbi:hypothetical protein PV326_005209 [Microctonus aethiopoides]|nr:hypothetical protein PV326_005209 [Microctonus aethiopoides]